VVVFKGFSIDIFRDLVPLNLVKGQGLPLLLVEHDPIPWVKSVVRGLGKRMRQLSGGNYLSFVTCTRSFDQREHRKNLL